MQYLSKREKALVAIILFLVVFVCGTFYMNKRDLRETIVTSSDSQEEKKELESSKEENNSGKSDSMAIYIVGAVKNPGVYKISDGVRVSDAILLAGGALPEADLNRLNLAKKLLDEDKVYIPKIGEKIEEAQSDFIEAPNLTINSTSKSASSRININTASVSQLDTLPGIGPVYAKNIIEYRNANGGFKSLEEIKNVSGIGDKRYENIKDMITID